MLKVVKRSKEYIAIKVPEVCEDVGKIVNEEAKKAGIRLDITTYYSIGRKWAIEVGVKNDEIQTVKRGSIIVCKISQDGSNYPEAVDVMGQKEFDKKFKPVEDLVKSSPIVVDADAKQILDRFKEIKAEMIAELDKALTDHQQKQEHSSQRASTPHVRIEFDDINDVPHVWIDGKYISSFPDHGLVRLNLEWNADKERIKPNHYCIEYHNGEDTNPNQYTGIGQTNETDE